MPVASGRAQPVEVAAGREPGQGREEDGRDRDREHALGQHVDAKRLVDRRRRPLGDEEAGGAVDQQVEVDQPEADRHRQHQGQHPAHVDVAQRLAQAALERRQQRAPQPVGGVLEVPEADRQLDHGAGEDADRVGVDLVALGKRGRQPDEHRDDRQVPEQGRDREGAEAVVAVQDPDHHPARPEQDQDREQDPREAHGEVRDRPVRGGHEHRHQQRRDEDEQRGQRAEHQADDEDQVGRQPEGLAAVAALELLGEHRDEGGLDRGVGEQAADQVRDLEGDRERRHRAADPEVGGGEDLPHQAGDPRERGGEGEECGRDRQPARPRGRGRRSPRLAPPRPRRGRRAHPAICRPARDPDPPGGS